MDLRFRRVHRKARSLLIAATSALAVQLYYPNTASALTCGADLDLGRRIESPTSAAGLKAPGVRPAPWLFLAAVSFLCSCAPFGAWDWLEALQAAVLSRVQLVQPDKWDQVCSLLEFAAAEGVMEPSTADGSTIAVAPGTK